MELSILGVRGWAEPLGDTSLLRIVVVNPA